MKIRESGGKKEKKRENRRSWITMLFNKLEFQASCSARRAAYKNF